MKVKRFLSKLAGLAAIVVLVLAGSAQINPLHAAISQVQGTTLNVVVTENVSITIEEYISLELNTAAGFTHTLTNPSIKTARDKTRDYSKKFYSLFANTFGLVADCNHPTGWKVQVKMDNLTNGALTLPAT